MATKKNINIGGVFNSITGDKKIIITDNVFDDNQGKFQDAINKETKSKLADQDTRITTSIQTAQQAAETSKSNAEAAAASSEQAAQQATRSASSASQAQQYAGLIKDTLDEIAGSADVGDATVAQVLKNKGDLTELALKVNELVDSSATVEISDSNDRLVEKKVNAILACLKHLIPNIVYHNGVPYAIPAEIKTDLKLEAHNTRSFAYGLSFPLTLN